ncbi:TPA: archease, partial [Candidatus Woesearchaeota archaeon]|nr:archease [Candidatus Woesearchaeota archaeon]
MKPSYTFIDHTADVLFEAKAETKEELFAQCGLALEETQVNLAKVEQKVTQEITGENEKLDRLLFDFLDDVLFYKDAELLIFNKFDITITKDETYKLHCIAHGEKLDHQKHEPKVDVKAITMHLFEVKEIDDGF